MYVVSNGNKQLTLYYIVLFQGSKDQLTTDTGVVVIILHALYYQL